MARLILHNATKVFGKRKILDNVNFELKTGTIMSIFGRNGCGKSTLLKVLFGTLKSTNLDLKIDDKSFSGSKIIKNQLIGYLPQFSFLPASARVRDVIPIFCEDEKMQESVFNANRMNHLTNQRVGTLSLGERRYLELLLIGNLEHPFLMLDEPFSMVEPLYKEAIIEFLISLKAKKGIILTDHYYRDAWKVSDKKYVLKEAVLKQLNTLEDLVTTGYLRSL
ncbi:MAG: ATP-binding cassette domain-containing protein [Leeuwenhoekiella sp.]